MLREAMENGEVIEVSVQMNDDPPRNVRMLFNGAAVGTVALVTL